MVKAIDMLYRILITVMLKYIYATQYEMGRSKKMA
jgi:hypothetical protein